MEYIPPFIPKQKDQIYKIKNKFEVYNNHYHDEFYIDIFFISEFKCKVYIKRMDNDSGWKQDLTIRIFDINGKISTLLFIHDSDSNVFIQNKIVNIRLIQSDETISSSLELFTKKNDIKNVVQMKNDSKMIPAIFDFITLHYNNYDYYFFDRDNARNFIYKNYDEKIVDIFDILYDENWIAEFFKLCFLYKKGGYYFPFLDIPKYLPSHSIDGLYDDSYSVNNFLYATPKNNWILHRIQHFLSHHSPIFIEKLKDKLYHPQKPLQVIHKTFEKLNIHSHKKFYLYPYLSSERFEFEIIDDILLITRIDQNSHWDVPLKIKGIYKEEQKEWNIGVSDISIKMVRDPFFSI